mmetsp:Transcript_16695/g.30645  ORF Transcript_16695/g.30645 Transcript_16695/m.30645 type:complete len:206 (-) Transcript_16695:264-881(-)
MSPRQRSKGSTLPFVSVAAPSPPTEFAMRPITPIAFVARLRLLSLNRFLNSLMVLLTSRVSSARPFALFTISFTSSIAFMRSFHDSLVDSSPISCKSFAVKRGLMSARGIRSPTEGALAASSPPLAADAVFTPLLGFAKPSTWTPSNFPDMTLAALSGKSWATGSPTCRKSSVMHAIEAFFGGGKREPTPLGPLQSSTTALRSSV